MNSGIILPTISIILLLSAAFYFSLAETAFSSVSRVRIKARADKGGSSAQKALSVLDNFDKAISTILIGTNLASLSLASLASYIAARRWGLTWVLASTAAVTLTVFFFCEMLPKSAAKKYGERISIALAPSMNILILLFTPLTLLLTKIGEAISSRSGISAELTVTEDELIDIVETMTEDGDISADRGDLLGAALAFGDVAVEAVLTARVDVAALDIESSPEEIIALIKRQKHSRLPVYRGSIDEVVGILQIRKYIRVWLLHGSDTKLAPLLDEAFFIHRSAKIDELLPELSRNKSNLAIVTDSYGGTLGIVTVEDILEELVGEIWDEDDEVLVPFIDLGDGAYELDPSLPVSEAFELMDYTDETDADFDRRLIGDWVYEQFGRIPSVGDSFCYGSLCVTVAHKLQNRIIKLVARKIAPADTPGEKNSAPRKIAPAASPAEKEAAL